MKEKEAKEEEEEERRKAECKLSWGKSHVCKRYWHNKSAVAETASCLQYIMSLLLLMGPDFQLGMLPYNFKTISSIFLCNNKM